MRERERIDLRVSTVVWVDEHGSDNHVHSLYSFDKQNARDNRGNRDRHTIHVERQLQFVEFIRPDSSLNDIGTWAGREKEDARRREGMAW